MSLVVPLALFLVTAAAPANQGSTAGGPVWVHPAGLAAHTVVLGDRGGQVVYRSATTEIQLLSAFDADPPATVWQSWSDGDAVAARNADAYLSTEYRSLGSGDQIVLHVRTSSSGAPAWSYEFTPQFMPFVFYDISDDGRVIVSNTWGEATGRSEIRVHDPSTGIPTRFFTLPPGISIGRLAVSPDGSMIAVSHGNHDNALTHVIDLATETVVFSTPGSIPRTNGLSAGGQVLLVQEKRGSDWHLRALVRGGAGYQDAVDSTFRFDALPNPCVLSDDGSTAAVAWYDLGIPGRFTVRAFDVASGTMTMERVLPVPDAYDWQCALAISADGSRFVVGNWGDGTGLAAELAVYSPRASRPLVEYPAEGTVLAVDISPDGDRFVASRMPASGPSVSVIELYAFGGEDLAVRGRPSIGTTVPVDVYAAPGSSSFLLSSPRLAAAPLVVPGAGTLYLGRAGLAVSPMSVVAPSGVATFPLAIANDPALVGRTRFYQGLTIGPRTLTRDFAQLTLLP